MLQVAGLEVDEERLDELSGLLEAASDAATNLDDAAGRVSLSEALGEFEPAWPAGERRSPARSRAAPAAPAASRRRGLR